jgi:DNA polymerase III delta subunit
MVNKEPLVYLFLGEDSFSKSIRIKKIKEELLTQDTEYFNLDVLYAKELTLLDLQEKLLCLPIKAKKRIILIRDSQNLKEEIKGFLIKYVKKPQGKIVLILDMSKSLSPDEFTRHLSRYAQVSHFREPLRLDTFTLSRSIDLRKTRYALWVLNQLLKNGEKPERILGGLRYAWENRVADPQETRKRLKIILDCDIDIKTGRLRSDFALEKLVVNLCGLT